jgi:hypothetical protein
MTQTAVKRCEFGQLHLGNGKVLQVIGLAMLKLSREFERARVLYARVHYTDRQVEEDVETPHPGFVFEPAIEYLPAYERRTFGKEQGSAYEFVIIPQAADEVACVRGSFREKPRDNDVRV